MSNVDWGGLLDDTRGYLHLDDNDPVPRDELIAQAVAVGYGDDAPRPAEDVVRGLLRDADEVEFAEGLNDDRVRLADAEAAGPAESSETDPVDDGSDDTNPGGETGESDGKRPASVEDWRAVDFSTVDPRVWAPAQAGADAWMCRTDTKAPYAPWADADAPVECNHSDHDEPTACDECDHHAGYKWGSE